MSADSAEAAAPPPPPAAPADRQKAGAGMRLLAFVLVLALLFGGAVMIIVGLNPDDTPRCEQTELALAAGECYDLSKTQQTIQAVLAFPSGVLAGIGLPALDLPEGVRDGGPPDGVRCRPHPGGKGARLPLPLDGDAGSRGAIRAHLRRRWRRGGPARRSRDRRVAGPSQGHRRLPQRRRPRETRRGVRSPGPATGAPRRARRRGLHVGTHQRRAGHRTRSWP